MADSLARYEQQRADDRHPGGRYIPRAEMAAAWEAADPPKQIGISARAIAWTIICSCALWCFFGVLVGLALSDWWS